MKGTVLSRLDRPEIHSLGIRPTWMDQAGPEFETDTLDGKRIGLAAVRGKIVLLNFWTTWCGACTDEIPTLEYLYRTFQNERFEILAINLRESVQRVESFRRETRISFPILMDRKGLIGEAYGVLGIPATFILDREGQCIGRTTGARDWALPPVCEFFRDLMSQV